MESLIREELNVKNVRFSTQEDVVVSIGAKANFKKLGKTFGPKMKDAATEIEKFTPTQILALESGTTIEIGGHRIAFDDIEIRRTKLEGIEVETEGELTVALDTTITPELKAEGQAREFINRVQNLRKTADLNVTDRIIIRCSCPEQIRNSICSSTEYVCSETLAVEIIWENQIQSQMETVEIDDLNVGLQITRAPVTA
jgi:isoleucyl-tRNA synthetase